MFKTFMIGCTVVAASYLILKPATISAIKSDIGEVIGDLTRTIRSNWKSNREYRREHRGGNASTATA